MLEDKNSQNIAEPTEKIDSTDQQAELKKILQKTIESNQLVLKKLNWVYRWVIWQQTWSVLKILVVVAAVALGAIYLPPVIKDIIEPLKGLTDFSQQFK